MSTIRSQYMTVHLPFDLLIEIIRRFARNGEYGLAETLSHYALACDENDPSARRWLEYVLEAQEAYEEAYYVHIENKLSEDTEHIERVLRRFK